MILLPAGSDQIVPQQPEVLLSLPKLPPLGDAFALRLPGWEVTILEERQRLEA